MIIQLVLITNDILKLVHLYIAALIIGFYLFMYTDHSFNELLLTRAIKQHEKLHNLSAARTMLSILKHKSIERVWKAVFEGM